MGAGCQRGAFPTRNKYVIYVSLRTWGQIFSFSTKSNILSKDPHPYPHTHTCSNSRTLLRRISHIPASNSRSKLKSISAKLESLTMMKPGCNTSICVAVVVQQSRHEWGFCMSFSSVLYLKCLYFYLKSWHCWTKDQSVRVTVNISGRMCKRRRQIHQKSQNEPRYVGKCSVKNGTVRV